MPLPRWAATRTGSLRLSPPHRRPSPTLAARIVSSQGYHSYEHPSAAGPFSDAESAILAAAYRHVPEHGFSQKSLVSGARDAGYLDVSAGLLPDGAFSLVRYHLATRREALAPRSAEIFAGDGGAELPVADKLERLTWERLLGNRDVISRWQEVTSAPHTRAGTHGPGAYRKRAEADIARTHRPWLSWHIRPTSRPR